MEILKHDNKSPQPFQAEINRFKYILFITFFLDKRF